MKKQAKMHTLKSGDKNDNIHSNKTELPSEKIDRQRLKAKQFMMNSPNKENHLSSANLLMSPLSPLHSLANLNNYQSPAKTTSAESFECLRSNKSKEALKENFKDQSAILYSGFSKDGKFKVESKSLDGELLEKAVQYERKTTLNGVISAGKEKEKVRLPELEPSKVSSKENGVVKAFAINTHAGISRSYNEDRVSITLNIKKNGVRSQFFAVYDGHGGSNCCDYLKDNLHEFVINHKDFPADPKKSLFEAIMACENKYCELVKMSHSRGEGLEKSGSCALIVLIVEDYCYVANVGDSRAILSTDGGRYAFNLSRDHRPIDTKEQQRVFSKGGKIYRTEMTKILGRKEEKPQVVIGPLRIYPGKLSVTRTIGDIEAKEAEFGGVKGVISAEPEVKKFKLTSKQDFILLCCDGIFEKMESMEVIEIAWKAMKKEGSIHELAGKGVDAILREAMRRKGSDNLTAIMLCLSDLKQKISRANYQSV